MIALINGIILTGKKDMVPLKNHVILIEDKKIEAIVGKDADLTGYELIDLENQYVESPEGLRVALENGVDSIEHGAKPSPEIIELFKKTGAFQVSTISPALPYALFDRKISNASYEQQENGKVVFNGIIELAKACLANDIPVGLGTDTACPYITQYDVWGKGEMRPVYYSLRVHR